MFISSIRRILIFFTLFILWSCEEDKGDKTDPEVSITSPLNGSTVNEIVTITCEATDNKEIDYVEFFVSDSLDSFLVSTVPYVFEWNTNNLENGTYSIKAIAYDISGNYAESSALILTVDNSLSFPKSVEIIDISYSLTQMTVRFRQSVEDDFKRYTLFSSSSSDSSEMVEIGRITERADTVFSFSEFDPTQEA